MTSPTPTISTLSTSSLKLTWKAEPNATSYRIDRRKSGDGTAYETIATTKDTKYIDTGLEENTKKAILNLVAKTGMSSAVKAAGAASSLGYHQPKEPKTLQNLKK